MDFSKCAGCGAETLFPVAFCHSCGSDTFISVAHKEGTVIDAVKVTATPETYPDEYFIVLFASGTARGFCRADSELKRGEQIIIESDALGPRCRRNR